MTQIALSSDSLQLNYPDFLLYRGVFDPNFLPETVERVYETTDGMLLKRVPLNKTNKQKIPPH